MSDDILMPNARFGANGSLPVLVVWYDGNPTDLENPNGNGSTNCIDRWYR